MAAESIYFDEDISHSASQEAYSELLDDIENIGNDFDNIDEFPQINDDWRLQTNRQFSSQILDDDSTFPLVAFVNSMSCWHLPTFDHSSWFCIGIYIILMVVIPFIKDGSTSIVFALNIPIFILFLYWYSWYAQTTVNEGIKFLSTGFYIMGAISFIVGIGVYYFLGLPTDTYTYYVLYYSQYYETYITILECFVIAFIGIAVLHQWLKYYLLTRGSNIEEITQGIHDDEDDNTIVNNERQKAIYQMIGACIGIGIGLQLCSNTISIILFDMIWQSRIETFLLRIVWCIPLSICTSYLIGCGVADREILHYQSSTFAILFLPVLYDTIAYFSLIVLVSMHTSVFLRFATLVVTSCINLVVVSAAIIEVWQRHHLLNTKTNHRITQLQMRDVVPFN